MYWWNWNLHVCRLIDIRPRFNVDTTLCVIVRRLIDVETTSTVYGIQRNTCRSSHPKVPYKKFILKKLAKFIKQQHKSPQHKSLFQQKENSLKKDPGTSVSLWILKIFKNNFFVEQFRWGLLSMVSKLIFLLIFIVFTWLIFILLTELFKLFFTYFRSKEGSVPAHYAAGGGHLKILQYLYEICKESISYKVRRWLLFSVFIRSLLVNSSTTRIQRLMSALFAIAGKINCQLWQFDLCTLVFFMTIFLQI